MSDTMVAAVASAVVGALVGGFLAFLANLPANRALRRQVKLMSEERDLMKLQLQTVRDGEVRDIVDPVLRLAAKIIAPVTLDCSEEEAWQLSMEWGQHAKELYVFVPDHSVWEEVNGTVRTFLNTLIEYKGGRASREDAENARQTAASKIRALAPSIRTATR